MTADGTILARKFINFASDKDHLYHVLNRIKKFQRLHGSREAHNFWAYLYLRVTQRVTVGLQPTEKPHL